MPTTVANPTTNVTHTKAPSRRAARRAARKEIRARRRDWRRSRPGILPRTFLGMAALVCAFSVGAAAAGVAATAWFAWRTDRLEADLAARIDAVTRVDADAAAGPNGPADPSAATLTLETVSELGNPVHGHVTVVATDGTVAYLAASLPAVRRATWDADVALTVSDGRLDRVAKIWSWDDRAELAILTVDLVGANAPAWVPADQRPAPGALVAFPGGQAVTINEITNRSITASGPVTGALPGTPLFDESGRFLAVTVDVSAPDDAGNGTLRAVPVDRTCDRLLACPG